MASFEDEIDLMTDGELSVNVLQEWLDPILCNVSVGTKAALLHKIKSMGPTSKTDLLLLSENDVVHLLPAFRAKKFLNDLKALCADLNEDVNQEGGVQLAQEQAPVYKFNMAYMSPEVRRICTAQEEPSESDYKCVVRLLGKFCKETRPPKEHMTRYVFQVTLDFVCQYPVLMEKHNGRKVNKGNTLLNLRVYQWVDNNSRAERDGEPQKRRKRSKGPSVIIQAPPVTDFDLGQAAKAELQQKMLEGSQNWDAIEIRRLVENSYAIQRSDIARFTLESPSNVTQKMWEEWPVLFTPIGAAVHFTAGCESNPNMELDQFMSTQVNKLKFFLIHKMGASVAKQELASLQARATIPGQDTRPLAIVTLLSMLSTLFKEDIEFLIKMVPENLQIPAAGQKMNEVPLTPCLVGQGTNAGLCSRYYLLVDGIRVWGPGSALQGLRVLFPTHFILSIAYNEKIQKTCQFYQRCIMGYVSQEPISAAVVKAMKEYSKFLSELE